jgi:hypothetical protein
VGDVATLITAIAGLVSALGGLLGAVAAVRALGRRERPRAARNVAAELVDAARDGVITVEELQQIAENDDREGGRS